MASSALLTITEEKGWTTVAGNGEDDRTQVRKLEDGLYMIRRGVDGTAVSITKEQLERILGRARSDEERA